MGAAAGVVAEEEPPSTGHPHGRGRAPAVAPHQESSSAGLPRKTSKRNLADLSDESAAVDDEVRQNEKRGNNR